MSAPIKIESFFIELGVDEGENIPLTFEYKGKEFLIPISHRDAGTLHHIFKMHDDDIERKNIKNK